MEAPTTEHLVVFCSLQDPVPNIRQVDRVEWRGSLRHRRTCHLPCLELHDEVAHIGIEAYSRFDFRSRVALTRGLKAYVVTENLFDRQYEEVLGYPALGRSVRLGVSWEWNMP